MCATTFLKPIFFLADVCRVPRNWGPQINNRSWKLFLSRLVYLGIFHGVGAVLTVLYLCRNMWHITLRLNPSVKSLVHSLSKSWMRAFRRFAEVLFTWFFPPFLRFSKFPERTTECSTVLALQGKYFSCETCSILFPLPNSIVNIWLYLNHDYRFLWKAL